MANLTQLIQQVGAGDRQARDELFAVAYGELRKLAHARLRDGGRNTVLQTTSLVHESYLRFLNSGVLGIDSRRAFFAYASKVMRSVIIDMARERQAERRGGQVEMLTLTTHLRDKLPAGEDGILCVHEALSMLEEAEPRLARIVEMRYFGGYSNAEIAETLELTPRTVVRDWDKARVMLKVMLLA